MAFVPQCTHDIFICHAHNDNQAPDFWVTAFYSDLLSNLKQRLSDMVDIHIDLKNSPDQKYRSQLQKDVAESAVFVPVLSPNQIESAFCADELDWFVKSQARPREVGNETSIFKVVKYPDREGGYKTWCAGITEIPFFKRNEIGSMSWMRPGDPDFRNSIDNLGWFIENRLRELAEKADKVFVCVAPGHNLGLGPRQLQATFREKNKNRVLPGIQITDFDVLMGRLKEYISEARLCIFVLAPGFSLRIPELYRYAHYRNKRAVVWLSQDDRAKIEKDPDRQGFLRAFEAENAEIFTTSDGEYFLDMLAGADHQPGQLIQPVVQQAFHTAVGVPGSPVSGAAQPTSVQSPVSDEGEKTVKMYIVCDPNATEERDKALCIVDMIAGEAPSGTIVPMIPISRNAKISRQSEEIAMRDCDAVFVFWGNGDSTWFEKNWRMVQTARNSKALGLFVANPEEPSRRSTLESDLEKEKALLGKTAEGDRLLEPTKLKAFLHDLGLRA
jgi:hypothetical protein